MFEETIQMGLHRDRSPALRPNFRDIKGVIKLYVHIIHV